VKCSELCFMCSFRRHKKWCEEENNEIDGGMAMEMGKKSRLTGKSRSK
jgi:hypothetical protein